MSKKKANTKGLDDVRKELQTIGDQASDAYTKTKDVKVALAAIKAYNGAISVAKTQVMYKRLTGFPVKIKSLE